MLINEFTRTRHIEYSDVFGRSPRYSCSRLPPLLIHYYYFYFVFLSFRSLLLILSLSAACLFLSRFILKVDFWSANNFFFRLNTKIKLELSAPAALVKQLNNARCRRSILYVYEIRTTWKWSERNEHETAAAAALDVDSKHLAQKRCFFFWLCSGFWK